MTTFYHSGHIYDAYDKLIRRIEAWLIEKVPVFWKFEKGIVRERLAQIIVATSFDAYASICAHRFTKGKNPIPSDDQSLEIGGLVIDPATGSVRIVLRLLIKSFVIFAYFWLIFLRDILIGILPWIKRDVRPATLLLGVGDKAFFYKDSDTRFVEFCKKGPIKPLVLATRLLIHATERKGSISHPDFVYTRNPISALVRESRLGAGVRLKLLLLHLLIPLKFFILVMRFPVMSLLARDIAYILTVRVMDRKKLLEAVLISDSSYLSQPLWMRSAANRNFLVHEIHYSQNSKAFQYVRSPIIAELPAFRHVRVDEHWVWTDGYKIYLNTIGHHGSCHVVGPILWYLPASPVLRTDWDYLIAVFDLTPMHPEKATKIGVINNYYTSENMLRFIREIVTVCEELSNIHSKSIRILLKHKRQFLKGHHDQRYITGVQDILSSHGQIKLIDYDTNLFSMLSNCDLAISIPFTSTAYISSYLEKPAIYFDPTGELFPSHEPTPFIQFASSKEQLMKAIEQCISKKLTNF